MTDEFALDTAKRIAAAEADVKQRDKEYAELVAASQALEDSLLRRAQDAEAEVARLKEQRERLCDERDQAMEGAASRAIEMASLRAKLEKVRAECKKAALSNAGWLTTVLFGVLDGDSDE